MDLTHRFRTFDKITCFLSCQQNVLTKFHEPNTICVKAWTVKNMISVQGLEVERAGDIQLLLETFYSGRKQALSTEVDVVSMWILSKNKLSSLFPFSTYLQLRTQLLILWLLFFRRRTLSAVMPLGKIYVFQFLFFKMSFCKIENGLMSITFLRCELNEVTMCKPVRFLL